MSRPNEFVLFMKGMEKDQSGCRKVTLDVSEARKEVGRVRENADLD